MRARIGRDRAGSGGIGRDRAGSGGIGLQHPHHTAFSPGCVRKPRAQKTKPKIPPPPPKPKIPPQKTRNFMDMEGFPAEKKTQKFHRRFGDDRNHKGVFAEIRQNTNPTWSEGTNSSATGQWPQKWYPPRWVCKFLREKTYPQLGPPHLRGPYFGLEARNPFSGRLTGSQIENTKNCFQSSIIISCQSVRTALLQIEVCMKGFLLRHDFSYENCSAKFQMIWAFTLRFKKSHKIPAEFPTLKCPQKAKRNAASVDAPEQQSVFAHQWRKEETID